MRRTLRGGMSAPWSIVVVLWALSLSLGLFALPGIDSAHESIEIRWWMLAIGFGLAESWVVHLHFRSETGSFSLFEVPLVFGLIFASPLELWLATILGTSVALIAVRRQPPIKVVFNVANLSLHAAVASLMASQLLGSDPLAPSSWLVLAGSTMAAGALQIVALAAIIAVAEGTLRRRQLIGMLATGAFLRRPQ